MRSVLSTFKESYVKPEQYIMYLFTFMYNFPHDFIEEVWEGNLAIHFRSKFAGYCSQDGYGSVRAFSTFFINLSDHNRKMLAEYIVSYINQNYLKQ
jgi:hypothetical protein